MLSDTKAKQVEFLSNMKQIVDGGHEDYFRWKWGDKYKQNIEELRSAYNKLISQVSSETIL